MRCPECGLFLIKIGKDPNVLCSSIYYQCFSCSIFWKTDESGIISKPANLQEVTLDEVINILR